MSFLHTLWSERTAIIHATHAAIVYGMRDTWSRCQQFGKTPQEPDFVAGLVLESAPRIYNDLRTILGPYKIEVSMASVFCHQTPKVAYAGASKPCELGDIMFVNIHTDLAGHVRRNALLYQAKKSSKQPYLIPKSEKHQLTLYTGWPQFTYRSPKSLAGVTRNVNPKMPHSGAQYMLIDDRPPNDPQSGLLCLPNTYPIGSCMADKCLHDHNHLAAEILYLLQSRTGKPFQGQINVCPADGWSKLVWDLVDIGLNKAFNRKMSGHINSPRAAGGPIDGMSFMMATSMSAASTATLALGSSNADKLFGPPVTNSLTRSLPEDDSFEPDSRVSIVLIETSEAYEGPMQDLCR